MKWTESVLTELRKALDFTLDTMELYDLTDAVTSSNRGSVRSALSRLTKNDIIERISRGVYKLRELFRLFRHTKRVIETHRKRTPRPFDLDIEATSEGFVPITANENRIINLAKFGKSGSDRQQAINMMKQIITRIEKIINPLLIDETMRLLANAGVFIGFTADTEGFADVEFAITGSEFKRQIKAEYSGLHEVEVILINAAGSRFPMSGAFTVSEDEF